MIKIKIDERRSPQGYIENILNPPSGRIRVTEPGEHARHKATSTLIVGLAARCIGHSRGCVQTCQTSQDLPNGSRMAFSS